MLPYDRNEEDFIIKYVPYPNMPKVKVYYANSSTSELYYNENIKNKLNEKMENQIRKINESKLKEIENDDKEKTKEGLLWALSFALSLNFVKIASFGILPLLVSCYELFLTVGNKIMLDQIIDDIYKNKMFIEEKELFKKLDKYNPEHLKSISGKAKKKIMSSENLKVLDINFIDDISHRDLLKIRKNLNDYFDKENGFSKKLGI